MIFFFPNRVLFFRRVPSPLASADSPMSNPNWQTLIPCPTPPQVITRIVYESSPPHLYFSSSPPLFFLWVPQVRNFCGLPRVPTVCLLVPLFILWVGVCFLLGGAFGGFCRHFPPTCPTDCRFPVPPSPLPPGLPLHRFSLSPHLRLFSPPPSRSYIHPNFFSVPWRLYHLLRRPTWPLWNSFFPAFRYLPCSPLDGWGDWATSCFSWPFIRFFFFVKLQVCFLACFPH